MAGIWTRADQRSDLVAVLNQVIDAEAGNVGAAASRPHRHVTYDASWSDVFRSTAGDHLAVLLAATSGTATPSAANSVLLVQDAAVSVGAGKQLRVYGAAGTGYAQITSDNAGLATLGGSGASAGTLSLSNLTVLTSLSLGATPATAGAIRLTNNTAIEARNGGNSADVVIATVDTSSNVLLGDISAAATTAVRGQTDVRLRIGATDVVIVAAGAVSLGTTPSTSGLLRLPNNQAITWRNGTNSADVAGLTVDGSNVLLLGDQTHVTNAYALASTNILLQVGANLVFQANTSGAIVGRAGGTLGFFGSAGAAKATLAAAAVDLATAIALANSIRTALIGYGQTA